MCEVYGPIGSCPCGSGKPYADCCYRSGASELRWTEPGEWPYGRTWPGQLQLLGERAPDGGGERSGGMAERTAQLLARVLPDLPVPALGNLTLREAWHSEADAQEAARLLTDGLLGAAHENGLPVPEEDLWQNIRAPRRTAWTSEESMFAVSALLGFQMPVRGLSLEQVGRSQRLWADAAEALRPRIRRPELHAAAVDYATCWMLFRPESQRDLAQIYRVAPSSISGRFSAMKHTLKLVWYDPRYCTEDRSWSEMIERTAQAIADGELDGEVVRPV